jgi:hypothetical protein
MSKNDTPAYIPLAARVNGARAWIPAKDRTTDEMISGHLVTVQRRQNNQGEDYPVVIIDCERPDGVLTAWHAQSLIAQEQLRKYRPAPGQAIGIVAHVPVASKARKDPNGNAVMYTNVTVYDPDADDTVTSDWNWDDAETETPDF